MESFESPTIWYKKPEFWLKFAAYALPIGFLLYVLYWNFLPFGYNETFTIQVGSATDTIGQFHLEPSRDLSERKTAPDGTTYRDLNGLAFAVFEPKAVLKNATVTVSVEGDGVSLTPLQLDFDPTSVKWANSWDFTSSTPLTDNVTKRKLVGTAFPFDGCMYFDGTSKLELPYSSNQFESGPFSVYTEWKPEDRTSNAQQIIGHYNWEFWQNSDSVEFRVGRMNNATGPSYSVKHPVGKDFFNQRHTALAVYSPATSNGYIDLYVDGAYAGRSYIGPDTIYRAYNALKNLTLGKSEHGIASHLKGCIFQSKLINRNESPSTKSISFTTSDSRAEIPVVSSSNGSIKSIVIHVRK